MTTPADSLSAQGEPRADPQADPRARALAPVATALVGRAEQHAARVRAAAEHAASAAMDTARRQAARIESEARALGRAEAEVLVATERAQAHREARAIVLRARAEVYANLCDSVRDGIRGLRAEACYPALVDRLAGLARAAAPDGPADPDLTIEEAADGGVVAVAPDLRIDLSAGALADRAVELLGAEVMELWEPQSPA